MCVNMDGSQLPIPAPFHLLSDNGISIVYRSESFIYKRSIPFLIENELWCLKAMATYGFAPTSKRWDKYTIRMTDLGKSEPVTSPKMFRLMCKRLLACLQLCGIRHGDLTEYAIIVKDNQPLLIDFAESRLIPDPRPDKRSEGDEYWLNKTMEKLCHSSQV